MANILIENATIITLGKNNRVLKDYSVLIENGKIKSLAPTSRMQDLAGAGEILDGRGKVVLPGFINTHTHFYSSFVRGLTKAKSSKSFKEVLENLWWRLDKKLLLEDCYYSALISCIDAIKKGTTTLFDHHASPFAITGSLATLEKAVREMGLRASLCYETSDRDGKYIAAQGIEENISFIKQVNAKKDNQIKAHFGLHASFTLDDLTIQKAVHECQGLNAGFHIHCAEDLLDQEVTKEKFKKTVIERLEDLGVLGDKTILAHGVHLSDSELKKIKKSGSILVHNPQSNMNNAVGVADIVNWQETGILFGLGTDAMTVNMLEELRSSLWLCKLNNKDPSVGFSETTNALFLNNAKIANRFFNNLGEVREGMEADIVMIDYFPPTELTNDNFLGHLVFGIAQSTVDTTIASGKILMKNKKLLNIDEKEIAENAQELSSHLWTRF